MHHPSWQRQVIGYGPVHYHKSKVHPWSRFLRCNRPDRCQGGWCDSWYDCTIVVCHRFLHTLVQGLAILYSLWIVCRFSRIHLHQSQPPGCQSRLQPAVLHINSTGVTTTSQWQYCISQRPWQYGERHLSTTYGMGPWQPPHRRIPWTNIRSGVGRSIQLHILLLSYRRLVCGHCHLRKHQPQPANPPQMVLPPPEMQRKVQAGLAIP